jgi:hypothetical protein
MNALEDLEKRLADVLSGRPRRLAWGDPRAMRASLERVRERFTRRGGVAPAERVARGVMALRILGADADFVHLKYACYGIAQHADWNGRRLLEDAALVRKLLACVEARRGNERRFAACRRGLLKSWREAAALPRLPATREGRALLQDFLFHEERAGEGQ